MSRKTTKRLILLPAGLLLVAIVWAAAPVLLANPAKLKTERPGATALMRLRERQAKRAGKPFHADQRWTPLVRMSPYLKEAVRVSEDANFYGHAGVDWEEARETVRTNWEEGRFARGASTITMQLARNLYLNPSKNPLRKLQEIALAYRLERALSKSRILEIYLNVVEWGDGIFGAQAAAMRHFGKPASDLTADEAARLAAVLPSPLRWDPAGDQKVVLNRKKIILRRLRME